MDGLLPQALTFAAMLCLGAAVPGGLVAWHVGGRWVWRLWLFVMAGIASYLVWFFGIKPDCCPTGMEGLALVILPLLGLGVGVGLFVGTALAALLRR